LCTRAGLSPEVWNLIPGLPLSPRADCPPPYPQHSFPRWYPPSSVGRARTAVAHLADVEPSSMLPGLGWLTCTSAEGTLTIRRLSKRHTATDCH
jgi:hypothetical protein